MPDHFAPAPPTPRSPLSGQVPAYRQMGDRVLVRAANEPRILGLGVWMQEVCRHRLRSPASERPEAENMVRRLLELQEALRLCDEERDPRVRIDVGCDQMKSGAAFTQPSSDIAVRDARGRIVRHIEVTSVSEPLRQAEGLNAAVEHVLKKAAHEQDGASHEGAVALNWADDVDPGQIIQDVVDHLNHSPNSTWRRAGKRLDRLTLESYAPVDPPRVYATLVNDEGCWRAEIGPFAPPEGLPRPAAPLDLAA
jgi:hypothetical protein